MKIIFLEQDALFQRAGYNFEDIKSLGEVSRDRFVDFNDEEEIVNRLLGYQVACLTKTKISRKVIEQLPDLKLISVMATGYDNIDIVACKEHGIMVTNVPGYGRESVAQHALSLLLEVTNRVGYHSHRIHQGAWIENKSWQFMERPMVHLAGKTMGIIGFGQIGQQMGNLALALGMKVLASARRPKKELEREHLKFCSNEQIFEEADVISIHAPANDQTRGLINKDTIARMKNGVIIINTGRGEIIVEEDLAEAIRSGKVYGAGLDVLNHEPMDKNNPLVGLDTCIITGHIASSTPESYRKLVDIGLENIRAFIEGQPKNVVNS